MQKLYFAITLLTLTALAGTAAIDPSTIREIAKEDHILENITVVILGASFALGVITKRSQRLYPKYLSLTLSSLSLIALLDEISFGQRIFNFHSIRIGGKYHLDGFHDIAEIAKNITIKSDLNIIWSLIIATSFAILVLHFYGRGIKNLLNFGTRKISLAFSYCHLLCCNSAAR